MLYTASRALLTPPTCPVDNAGVATEINDVRLDQRGYAMSISFAQVECRRCTVMRIRGVACVDCGIKPEPWEVDPDKQRRQGLVADALRVLEGAPEQRTPPPDDVTGSGTFARTGRWLGRFLSALQAAVPPGGDGDSLDEALAEFVELRADAAAMPRLRPWLALVDTSRSAVAHLECMARGFLAAVAAETPIQAQEAAAKAQSHLDEAAGIVGELNEERDRWQRATISSNLDELLPGLTLEARQAAGAQDLLQLEASGAADYEHLTGQECPRGLGVVLRILLLQADNLYDPKRFRLAFTEAYRCLIARPERLDALLAAAAFKVDLRDALVKAYDSGQSTELILNAALHPRQHVGAVLDMSHTLFEGPGKRHIAALLSVIGSRQYERLREVDAGALRTQADQAGMGALLAGLDPAVRGAKAHLTWTLEDGEVVLNNRGVVRRMPVPTLIDHVLAAQESVLALTFAMTCAAASRGVDDLIEAGTIRDCGLSDAAYITALARCFGLSDVILEEHGDLGSEVRWTITGHADLALRQQHQGRRSAPGWRTRGGQDE